MAASTRSRCPLLYTNLPAAFSASLSYDAKDAFLNLTLNFTPPSPPNFGSGLNGNQQAVGNALSNFFNSNGSIPIVFGSLTPAGLTQASGEVATGSQQTTLVSGLKRSAVRLKPGAICLRSSSHFPISDSSMKMKPVILPPGLAILATCPKPTGSLDSTKTIGIERVA
jgi:hypothetical protein